MPETTRPDMYTGTPNAPAPEAGAPENECKDKIVLPPGLDWETVGSGIALIEEWELSEPENAVALVIAFHSLFGRLE
jgi:hypothetical protein